jgi:hypothetical protein
MVDLELYKDHRIEYKEADSLPAECIGCNDDCGSCDFAGLRWQLSKRDQLILQRKMKVKSVERIMREISRLDAEIEGLK